MGEQAPKKENLSSAVEAINSLKTLLIDLELNNLESGVSKENVITFLRKARERIASLEESVGKK